MSTQGYGLGCPIWANKAWVGDFFAPKTPPRSFLSEYASVFNAVEGNTTFYALPKPKTVERWRDETPEGFRFCLKFHRVITHEKRLRHTEAECAHFFHLFEPLAPRLGPLMLQLPPSFGVRELPALEAFLDALPEAYQYAVEVRHRDFFKYDQAEEHLNGILSSRGVDRVILDSRGVHRAMSDGDEGLQEVQSKKPSLPVRYDATGPHPIVRYISHPALEENRADWEHWARVLAGWRDEGQHPYFFVHTPDDTYAPTFARAFHQILEAVDPSVGALPPWPGERPPEGEQFQLF